MDLKETYSFEEDTDDCKEYRRLLFKKFCEDNAWKITSWQNTHPSHVKPPIFWAAEHKAYVWLNREQIRARARKLRIHNSKLRLVRNGN